jgi:hypothetical protein
MIVGALAASALLLCPLLAAEVSAISVVPEVPRQGDPLLLTISAPGSVTVSEIRFKGKELALFSYKGKPTALYGIDLEHPSGVFPVEVVFRDGSVRKEFVIIEKRKRITAPLGIPEKLGGNTKESQQKLVSSLRSENESISAILSTTTLLWSEPFLVPLEHTTITDTYGYSRLTGDYQIPHKGLDFRASLGTPVFAMNGGIVALSREYRVYGKTIAIDHGLGLVTLYLHLSELGVSEGESVSRWQKIGRAGASGYAEAPHLHVSIRIGGTSIDPLSFLSLFDEE